jgi:hypothetical protein
MSGNNDWRSGQQSGANGGLNNIFRIHDLSSW